MFRQGAPSRSPSQPPLPDLGLLNAPGSQILSRPRAIRRREEDFLHPRCGLLAGLRASALPLLLGAFRIRGFHSRPRGKPGKSLLEGDFLLQSHEVNHVPADPAPEAVEQLLFRRDLQGGIRVLMEGAASPPFLPALRKVHVSGDDLHDVVLLPDLLGNPLLRLFEHPLYPVFVHTVLLRLRFRLTPCILWTGALK